MMEDMMKVEVGNDTSVGEEPRQQFALLLWVTKSNGILLSVGGFTG